MCPYYRDLNKITNNNKFPILNIDELLNEFHGVDYYIIVDLKLAYHQIILREKTFPKPFFEHMNGTMSS